MPHWPEGTAATALAGRRWRPRCWHDHPDGNRTRPFLSAHVGYWIDKDFTGRGIGSAAVAFAVAAAREHLGLHRIQAATLKHNEASRRLLRGAGFEEIGLAPSYLKIAGIWQDHVLFQRILE